MSRGINVGGINAEIDIKINNFNTQMNELKRRLKEQAEELKKLAKEIERVRKAYEQEVKTSGESSKKAKELKNTLEGLEQQFKAQKTAIDATGNELADLNNKYSSLVKAQNDLKDSAKTLTRTFTLLKAVMLSAATKKLSEVFIGSNAEIEQYITSFDVLLGSYEKAEQLVNDLYVEAARTPFVLTDLTDASKTLMSFGFTVNKTKKYLGELGDLSLGNAERLKSLSNAFGQIAARSNATMRELKIFVTNGIPIIDALAQSMGTSTNEIRNLVQAGKVGFSDVEKAIKSMTSEGGLFYKGLEKQSKTAKGLFSTITDELQLLGREIGEEGFNRLKEDMEEFLKIFRELQDSGELDVIVSELGASIADTITILNELLQFIIKNRDEIVFLTKTLITWKLANMGVEKSLKLVNGTLGSVLKGAIYFKDGVETVNRSAIALNLSLSALKIGLTATIGVLAYCYSEIQKVKIANEKAVKDLDTKNLLNSSKELKIAIEDNAYAISKMSNAIGDTIPKLEKLLSISEKDLSARRDISETIEELNRVFPELNAYYDEEHNQLNVNIEDLKEYAEQYRKTMEIKNAINEENELKERKNALKTELDIRLRMYDNYVQEIMGMSLKELKAEQDILGAPIIGEGLTKEQQEKLQAHADYTRQLAEELLAVSLIAEETTKKNKKLADSYEKLETPEIKRIKTIGEITADYQKMINSLEGVESANSTLADSEEYLTKSFDKNKDALEFLNGIIEEYADKNILSSNTIYQLLQKYPHLYDAIEETSDGYIIQMDKVEELRKNTLEANRQIIISEREKALAIWETYGALLETRKITEEYDVLSPFVGQSKLNEDFAQEIKEYEEQGKKLNELYDARLKMLDVISKAPSKNANAKKSSASSSSKQGETAQDKFLRDLKYQYDMGIIDAKNYYSTLEKFYKKYYAEGTKEWQRYSLEVKRGYEEIAKSAQNAARNAYEGQMDSLQNQLADEEFYGTLDYDKAMKYYSQMEELARDYYDNGILTFKEYASKMQELEKNRYSLRKEMFENINKQLEESANKRYKDAIDRINKYYDDLAQAERDRERERTLSELRQAENLYEGAVSRRGQQKLKEIQDDIRKLEMDKAKDARESARASDLENIEKIYENLKEKQSDYFDTISNGAMSTAQKVSEMSALISDAFDKINGIVNGMTNNNNTTNYNTTINQKNIINNPTAATALVDMTNVLAKSIGR